MSENGNTEDVQDVDMIAEVGTQYAAFAKSANARSIPDVRDGMKPVHRRIVEIALDMAPPGGSRKKSAAVVGAVLGRRHPHGDASVYDAMCRLTKNWELPLPLIEPQGNFGAIDGSGAAAARYTEVRFSGEAKWLLTDGLYEDAVPFRPNYSEEESEPELLPVRVPMALINGVPPGSIGVGYASVVPTHNPAEVCRAAALLIRHWGETGEMPSVAQLMGVMPGPDFCTGGILSGPVEISALYETGGAGLRVRANAVIEGDRIVFDGVPPGVTTSKLAESIAEAKRGKELQKGKRADPTVPEVREVRDETSKAKGSSQISIRIIVELRQGEDAAIVLEKLYKYTDAEVSYPCNMTLLDPDGKERQMGLVEILSHWVGFRESCVRRVANFRLRKASDRQHAIQGLQKAMANIDTVIALIRGSPNDEQTKAQLEGVLGVTSRQSETIISMPLRQLNALRVDKLAEEAKELEEDVGRQMRLLTDRAAIFEAIIAELDEAAERLSRIERRTTIAAFGRAGDDARAFVTPERALLMLSDKGYLRRQPAGSLRAQGRGTRGSRKSGVRDGEALTAAVAAHTHDRLYLFTNTGFSVRCDVHEIPSGGLSHGSGIGLEENEIVAGFLPVPYPLPQSGSVVLADSAGQVKRFSITEVDSSFRRLRAYQAEEGHQLIGCSLSPGGADVFFASRRGLGTRFSEEDVRLTRRESGGVRGMDIDLETGDTAISTGLITDDSQWILCVVSSGMGKRVPVAQFPTQQRGGKGRILIKLREGEELVSALIVRETDDVVVFSESGLANRLHVADVLAYGRETMGKKLMELPPGDRVVSAAIVPEGEN